MISLKQIADKVSYSKYSSPKIAHYSILVPKLKIKDCNLIKIAKNMFWALTDQFAIVESKLELKFE